jgi:hypothetical protein
MVDPQITELSRVMNEALISGFIKYILPVLIIGGFLDLVFHSGKKRK